MFPITSFIVLILSVVIHELAHGFVAYKMGDPTAKLQGRLTLNPLKHLDPVGSIVVPILTSIAGFTFGWAKPVPYNPYNLKNKRLGEFTIALAGPASNILIAIVFSIIARVIASSYGLIPILSIFYYIVIINIVLALFNLIPLPPLDGSKLLFSILPEQYGRFRNSMEAYGMIFIFVVIFFLWRFISPLVLVIFQWFTGVGF